MKQWTRTLATWFVITLLLTGCSANPTPTDPRLVVRVGTSASFPPFESLANDQESFIGFDIELMKAIAAKSNLEVIYTSVPYETLLAGIATCTYDAGIAAITVDDTLKSQMRFSDSYYTVGQVIVVKEGNLRITGGDTLAGQTVGVQANTAGAAAASRITGIKVQAYPALDQAIDELVQGLIDAVVTENTLALGYTQIPANNLKVVGDAIAFSSYAIAVCPERADLLQRINGGLAAVRAAGTLDQLRREWIVGNAR